MSGKDEQPEFPICPRCIIFNSENSFWTLGHTETDVTEDMEDSSDVSLLTDHVYLDRLVNDNQCARTNEVFNTHVMIPISQQQGVDVDASIQNVLAGLLFSSNVVMCSEDHIFGPESEQYKIVIKSTTRFANREGVKWE